MTDTAQVSTHTIAGTVLTMPVRVRRATQHMAGHNRYPQGSGRKMGQKVPPIFPFGAFLLCGHAELRESGAGEGRSKKQFHPPNRPLQDPQKLNWKGWAG